MLFNFSVLQIRHLGRGKIKEFPFWIKAIFYLWLFINGWLTKFLHPCPCLHSAWRVVCVPSHIGRGIY